jgi:predicted permease
VPIDIWFPITMQAAANPGRNYLRERKVSWLLMMARLKPGISPRQAESAANLTGMQIFRELYKGDQTPEEMRSLLRSKIQIAPGGKGFSRLRHESSVPLMILMAIVGVILLICCANVANLQLARALNRGREMGLRLAVGAGQWRLIRQLLTESLLLSIAGGLVGLLFAYWGSHLLLRLISPDGVSLHTELNASVLSFTAGIAILSGLLFGLAPAFRTAQVDLVSSLKESKSGQQPDGFSRAFGRLLVVSQIVLSVILLVFAGLFLSTLRNLRSIDVGYSRQGLLLLEVDPKTGGYKDVQVTNQMTTELLRRLQQIPGVATVSYSENGLFSGTSSQSDAQVEGYIPHSEADKSNESDLVGPGYFEVVGTRILAGRGIESSDNERTEKIAVINEKMGRFYFPHANPIGRHLFDGTGSNRVALTIVGVVADAKQKDLRQPVERRFYEAYLQRRDPVAFVNFEIRTTIPSEQVTTAVRRTIAGFNRNLPITSLASADALIDDELSAERLVAQISSFFGVLALLLGAIGLYGVMAYMTTRRTSEIGIRLALGAKRSQVIGLVLSETGRLVALGLAIGIVLSTLMARLFEKSLFGLSAFDPATTVAAVAVISLAALVAAYLPARRASRVDPLIALRYE